MVNNIFLALGSNKGDKYEFIKRAIVKINENPACKVLRCSSIYETTPYGKVDQPHFMNAVCEIESDYSKDELLTYLKNLEKEIGRTSKMEKWGQREIDVDIIFYNDVIYNCDKLTIPHPDFFKRDFVVVPLLEIAPNFIHPVSREKIRDIDLSSLEKHIVHKIDFPLNI